MTRKIVRNVSTPLLAEMAKASAAVDAWPERDRKLRMLSLEADAYFRGEEFVPQLRDKPRRTPRTKISLYLPADVLREVEREAERLQRSLSWVIERWIRERRAK